MRNGPLQYNVIAFCVIIITPLVSLGNDINNDGMITMVDVELFMSKVLNNTSGNQPDLDFNSDGSTDIKDALQYGQWVNGQHSNSTHKPLFLKNQKDTAAYIQYKKNLKERKNSWTEQNLVSSFPFSFGSDNLNYNPNSIQHFSRGIEMLQRLGISDSNYISDFMTRTAQKGIAVCGKTNFPNYVKAFDAVHSYDMPVIITTDAILDALYMSYDNILMCLEDERFYSLLDSILLKSFFYCNAIYPNTDYAQDIRNYLGTALCLLKPGRTDITKSAEMGSNLDDVNSLTAKSISLCGVSRVVDFSQFKPRGHYTKNDRLTNYFKCMMWLSRADLAFMLETTPRMKKAACVLWDCVVNSGMYKEWLFFNSVIEFMVGQSDGMSVKDFGYFISDLNVHDVVSYTNQFDEDHFDSTLTQCKYGIQMVLSTYYTDVNSNSLNLPRIFSFMPQRFVIDSYSFSQMVHPLVPNRFLPTSTDVAFLLGDNSSLQNYTDLTTSSFPGVMGSLRDLFDQISPEGWHSNLYNGWINSLRQLNNAADNSFVSPVFRTKSWNHKMRNTQLNSWAQLRYCTLLYVKQSYTGLIICYHPSAYIEPYPDFFSEMVWYTESGKTFFKEVDNRIYDYFVNAEEIMKKLFLAAQTVAAGQELSQSQENMLKDVITTEHVNTGCGLAKIFNGWYNNLIFEYGNSPEEYLDFENGDFVTIADVHTKLKDEATENMVWHGASGYINLAAVIVERNGTPTLYIGPVGSYYDVTTVDGSNPVRLTREEWQNSIRAGGGVPTMPEAKRPVWSSEFLVQ